MVVNNVASQFTRDELVLVGEVAPVVNDGSWPPDYPTIHYVDPNLTLGGRGSSLLRWLRLRSVIRRICAVAQQEEATRLMCIFPNDFYLFAAYKASKRLGLPLYTWFHNTYLDNCSGYRKVPAAWLQPRVFDHARKTFVMSDGMLEFFNRRYPGHEFETLVHGFPLPQADFKPFRPDTGKIKCLFSGSLNASCEDATVRLISTLLRNPACEVHLFTGNPFEDFTRRGLAGSNLIYNGFVGLDELYRRFEEFDVMLLPHGFDGDRTDAEFKTIFPTRTIPLLVSNRPILAHTPKGVFLTDFLRQHECAAVVDTKDVSEINAALARLVSDEEWRNGLVKNSLACSQMFDVVRVTDRIKQAVGLTAEPDYARP